LEKGEMRVEANISVSKTDAFGTKVEVKNLNSFRSVERAIEYEVARQIAVLEEGGTIAQETRGWDENKQSTFSQRTKEGSTDYRYFPEPDIPKMQLSLVPEWSVENIRRTLPELPWERRARYEQLGIKKDDVITLVSDVERAYYFDELIESLGGSAHEVLLAVNYLINDIGESTPPSIAFFTDLVRLISDGKVSSRGAKDILKNTLQHENPLEAATRLNVLQESDPEALKKLVEGVIFENQAVVAEYKSGKDSALQFLVGQAMKASKGTGNPAVIRDTLHNLLS
jgi:aspartyl-tRNA(Asn)/glutamyl-tRNA(Gln) amidotransferase subunit B